jgi:hypothetical protein
MEQELVIDWTDLAEWRIDCDCGETWEGDAATIHYEAAKHCQKCDENRCHRRHIELRVELHDRRCLMQSGHVVEIEEV